jgi:uncharacterized protein
MKKTIDHLPETKRREILSVVFTIQENCDDVEMIILFGSYARGDYKTKEDLTPDRKSGHISDYDLLVVTRYKETAVKSDLWDTLLKKCRELRLSAYPRVIAHDIQELNIKLAEGQFFFSDIKKEGCILFDSGRFQLADKRKLTPEDKQRIAQDHFDHWFDRATGFFGGYQFHYDNQQYGLAAFNLHQTAESCYKTAILVFTNYNPNEHWLALLSDIASEEESSFSTIFPIDTEEDKKRFDLLDYAYIGGRYDPKYRISKEDLEMLSVPVKKLLNITEKLCVQKIKSFVHR